MIIMIIIIIIIMIIIIIIIIIITITIIIIIIKMFVLEVLCLLLCAYGGLFDNASFQIMGMFLSTENQGKLEPWGLETDHSF